MRSKDVIQKAAVCQLIDKLDQLTDEQIEYAYMGYQQRMIDLGNLIITAIRKSLSPNSEPFVFQQQYSREETFERFNIKEE